MWGFYDKVSAFVCPSHFMKRELEELGSRLEKSIRSIRSLLLKEKGNPDLKTPYLLYIGRLASYKGIDTAIRAFSRLKGSSRMSTSMCWEMK